MIAILMALPALVGMWAGIYILAKYESPEKSDQLFPITDEECKQWARQILFPKK